VADERLVLRQRRGLGEIIGDGLQVYVTRSLVPILLVLAIPGAILELGLLAIHLNTSGFAEFILLWVGLFLGFLVGTGAIYALDQYDKNDPVPPGQALLVALSRALDLIGAGLRGLIIVLLLCMTIVGIPWGIHRLFRWWFSSHAIMLDGQDGETALEYSASVVAGRGWPTAGYVIVLGVMTGVPSYILLAIISSSSSELTAGLWSVALTFVIFPFNVTTTLLVYYDLKLRKAEVTASQPPAADDAFPRL
jgi:hypothetical protein